jgi:hypothetical protein
METDTRAKWTLPPLILHPFSDGGSPQKLARSSRAALLLEGLIPSDGQSTTELEAALLEGRWCEMRMLFYVGKDLARWVEQCVEFAQRQPELAQRAIGPQSFADLLIEDTPANVFDKLSRWAVVDYRSIFSRAFALHILFSELPDLDTLAPDFIIHYFQYADEIYAFRRERETYDRVSPEDFEVELYASGEYSRMLEREWA